MDISELYCKVDTLINEAIQRGELELAENLKVAQLELEENGPQAWETAINTSIESWLLKDKNNAIALSALFVVKELTATKARSTTFNKIFYFFFCSVFVLGLIYAFIQFYA